MSSTKIIYLGISLILIVIPLIHVQSISNPYEYPKFIVFVIATYLLTFFWVISRIKEKQYLKISKREVLPILIIAFGVITFIADIFGLDPKISLIGSMWRHQGFLTLLSGISFFFLVRFQSKSEHSFKTPITISLFSVSLCAIFQGISFNLFHDNTIPTYLGRIVGTFGNPNSLAGYLIMLLPFIFFQEWNNRRAAFFLKISAIVLVAITMVITQSQSAIVASIIMLFIFVKKQLPIIIPALFFIIVASIFSVGIIQSHNEYGRFESSLIQKGEKSCMIDTEVERLLVYFYQKNLFFLTRKSYCENRILIWAAGLKAFAKSPILGYGQENYELIFPKNLSMKVDNAHNIFIEVAVSSGFIGIILFIAIIIVVMKHATIAVRLSLVAFLIVAQFNPLSIPQLIFFWFLLGIHDKKELS